MKPNYPNQKVTREQVEVCFLGLKSFSETSKRLGISKERVRQIINRSRSPLILEAVKIIRHVGQTSPFCLSCERVFGKEIGYGNRNLCRTCYGWKYRGRPENPRVFYPKTCSNCGI
jgi:hypothetical protein